VLYQDTQVTVTTTRFQAGPDMYPIRNISAVSADERHTQRENPADTSGAILCFIAGALAIIGAVSSLWSLVAAPPFLIAGAVLAYRAEPKRWTESHYVIIVNTAGMQRPAFWTTDRAHRDAILTALHRAVAGG